MSSLESKSLALLLHCDGIGHVTARSIADSVLKSHISWDEFWAGDETVYEKIDLTKRCVNSIKNTIKEYTYDSYDELLKNQNIRVISEADNEYPPLLREIERPPVILFVQGPHMQWDASIVPIAVVGTRHMTAYGRLVTEKITTELVRSNAKIISGFMYGVDTCAHTTALAEHGKTIGVLGYGFNAIYPSSHRQVFAECLAKGMSFVTPFAPNVQPTRGNFPARNAIVAGMSAAVVVTEAGEKSGTHITAACAGEYGRTVCAVPGPITSPYAQGTKWLVNQGAVLVSSGEEVLEASGLQTLQLSAHTPASKTCRVDFRQRVLSLVQTKGPMTTNAILSELGCPAHDCYEALTLLELNEQLSQQHQLWVAKK